ncbi:putative ATPase, nucleotide binding domain-containing protein [Helianthus anomalus]
MHTGLSLVLSCLLKQYESLSKKWVDIVMFTCSGYGIAAKALTSVIRSYDGRGPETMLTCSILHQLQLSSPDELIGY